MKSVQNLAANSDVYAQVEHLLGDDAERRRALATLHSADVFVENVAWVAHEIKHLFKTPASKATTTDKQAA